MNPKVLFWLSLGALGILVLSLLIPAFPVVGCLAVNDTAPTACTTTIAIAVFVATSLIVVGGMVATVAWIVGLVFAAQREEWGWFAAILFLTPIATLIYSRRLVAQIGRPLRAN